ncbi:MAG: hypothetical protein CGW95_13530 [Phenylobacterium zucineum]|nr:MAG: hypothetical protein CGW95_13530 [Phenylobacterium zucineum]
MPVTPNSIITPQIPKAATAALTAANTVLTDSPTNTVTLVTAGSNGARVTKISAIPRATLTATLIQLFRSTDAGVTKRLFDCALIPACTITMGTDVPTTDFGYSEASPILLQAGESIYAALGATGNVCVLAEWGDY